MSSRWVCPMCKIEFPLGSKANHLKSHGLKFHERSVDVPVDAGEMLQINDEFYQIGPSIYKLKKDKSPIRGCKKYKKKECEEHDECGWYNRTCYDYQDLPAEYDPCKKFLKAPCVANNECEWIPGKKCMQKGRYRAPSPKKMSGKKLSGNQGCKKYKKKECEDHDECGWFNRKCHEYKDLPDDYDPCKKHLKTPCQMRDECEWIPGKKCMTKGKYKASPKRVKSPRAIRAANGCKGIAKKKDCGEMDGCVWVPNKKCIDEKDATEEELCKRHMKAPCDLDPNCAWVVREGCKPTQNIRALTVWSGDGNDNIILSGQQKKKKKKGSPKKVPCEMKKMKKTCDACEDCEWVGCIGKKKKMSGISYRAQELQELPELSGRLSGRMSGRLSGMSGRLSSPKKKSPKKKMLSAQLASPIHQLRKLSI